MEPERRARLVGAKLRALVAARWGDGERTPGSLQGVASLTDGTRGWALADGADPVRSLGPVLFWALRRGLAEVHVIVDDGDAAGVVARRASAFAAPGALRVWRVVGAGTEPADAAPPADLEPRLPDEVAALATVVLEAGAVPVVEDGTLIAEVEGLEVARAVVERGAAPRLEVGVGRHDREARFELRGWAEPPPDDVVAADLARTVDLVRGHRRPGAPPHLLNRLARARALRAAVVHDPNLVRAATLRAVASPAPRSDLRLPSPAIAAGVDDAGAPVVVVCSVGIDVDLVPTAADARLSLGADHRLVLAVPPRDDHPLTRDLAAALRAPAEVVLVDGTSPDS